jgi:hypothetical protein
LEHANRGSRIVTRSNLIIVRAGEDSLHPKWLVEAAGRPRNWDLIVNYFGDDPEKYQGADWIRIASKGRKWTELYRLIGSMEELVRKYEYIWLPDDDLDSTCEDINRFFEICASADLQLAQPSLTHDSYFGHMITLHNPGFRLRYTTFVEIMAPCFSRAALRDLLPTFNEPDNLSGLGLEYIWAKQLTRESRMAIVDEIQIRHTRPMGGANYDIYKPLGTSAWDQMLRTLERHGIQKRKHVNLGGVPTSSDSQLPAGWRFLFLYGKGLLSAGPRLKIGWRAFPRRWLGAIRDQVRG